MFKIRTVRLLAIAAAAWCSFAAIADTRGVQRPARERAADAIEPFDPKQSAALFVGVRSFPYDSTLADVRYAVDDAIDLAFVFAIDERVRLVDPARVILALSGDPQKPESRQNLDRLVAAGAKVRSAGQADIITALQEQARAAGRNGLLVVAFATHGVSFDGTQHLLTATSVLPHREMTISESKIRDIASRSDAARSLIIVDACRERLTDDRRNGKPDLRSAASLIRAMSDAHGQVILSAAAAGQYAYDDEVRRNGVFTAAVIDGLRCEAPMDARGLVTVDALSAFVEKRVLTWIRKQRGISAERATQVTYEGSTKSMPLAECRRRPSRTQSVGCKVSIGSSPIGATVYVDGKEIGATPLSSGLAQGQRAKVVLVKAGYTSAASDVDCTTGPVFMTLQPRSEEQQVLFRDGFDDNRNGWQSSTDPDAPAHISGGVYVLGSKLGGPRIATIPIALDPERDFEIRCVVTKIRGLNSFFFGLVWGLGDENHFFNFGITADGHVAVSKKVFGFFKNYVDASVENPHVRKFDGANRIVLRKTGSRLLFLLNGHLIHEMPFQRFFGNRVGFIVWQDIHLAFDDLEVLQAPASARTTVSQDSTGNSSSDNESDIPEMTNLCYFTGGLRRGESQRYPDLAPLPVGSSCHDGKGSYGLVVSEKDPADP